MLRIWVHKGQLSRERTTKTIRGWERSGVSNAAILRQQVVPPAHLFFLISDILRAAQVNGHINRTTQIRLYVLIEPRFDGALASITPILHSCSSLIRPFASLVKALTHGLTHISNLLVTTSATWSHWQLCDDVNLFRSLQEIVYDASVWYLKVIDKPFSGLTLANGPVLLNRLAFFVSLLCDGFELLSVII